MKIERIDHLHFYVKDLESTIEKFADLLGLEFQEVTGLEKWGIIGIKDAVASPGFDVIQPTTDPTLLKLIESKGEGLHGVSFKVSDIDEAIEELKSKGIKLLWKYRFGSLTEALFESPDFFGVALELCEYPGDDINAAYYGQPTDSRG